LSKSSNIELFLTNARSIRRKSHLLSFVKSLSYNLILISETWLCTEDSDAYLLGSNDDYVSFRKDRPTNAEITRGGGVAILCSPLLNPFLVSSFATAGIESIIIDIHFPHSISSLSSRSIRICLIYRAPSYLGIIMSPSIKFTDHVSKMVSKALSHLSLQTLEHRRMISDLLFTHKSIHGFYSYDHSNLYRLAPLSRNLRRSHNLRISLPFVPPKSHSNFATRIIDRWNALSAEIVTSPPHFFRSHLLSTPSISFSPESLL
ncbi:hypothetical protein PENTCL1PPCAC_3025, partial [Pristionchus entomophagus]